MYNILMSIFLISNTLVLAKSINCFGCKEKNYTLFWIISVNVYYVNLNRQ